MTRADYAGGMYPLDVGSLVGRAFEIVKRHAPALFTVTLLVLVPVELIALLIDLGTGAPVELTSGDMSGSVFAGQMIALVLAVLGGTLTTGATYRIVAGAEAGEDVTWQESMRFALERFGPLLILSLAVGVLVAIGTVLLVIPGVWLAVALSVAAPALLVENLGVGDALSRSRRLVKDRWWATLGRLLVAGLLIVGAMLVVGMIVGGALTASGDSGTASKQIIVHTMNLVASVLTTPFLAAVIVLVYFDLRARKEGFDPSRAHGVPPPPAATGHWPPPA